MIDSLLSYIKKDVAPRYHRIIFTTHPWLSALVGVSIAAGCIEVADNLKFFDVAGPLLTYNTVVIGFCVSAMAICFTFSKRFSAILCRRKDPNSGISAYRDLIFVFSWTALTHLLSSVVLLFSYFIFGNFILHIENGFSYRIFLIITVQLYCILQFVVTVITVHQVANIYALINEVDSQ